MKTYDYADIVAALLGVGLQAGDTVYASTGLYALGKFAHRAKGREVVLAAFLEAFREVVGPEGTVVVPTFTTNVARFDLPFVYEETSSMTGAFSEYVRTRPDSLRSLHPIHSVCANGHRKEGIVLGTSNSDYGFDSPFDRMLSLGAKMVSVGLDLEAGFVVANAHHIEAMFGVPYKYTKLLKWKPVRKGKEVDGVFTASVQYLHLGCEYDFLPFVRHIVATGGVKEAVLGDGKVYASEMRHVFREGIRLLKANPHFFLNRPPDYRYGEVPFDGPTINREDRSTVGVSAEDDASVNWAGYHLAMSFLLKKKKLEEGG